MLYIYIDDCKSVLPKEFESYVSDYFNDVYEPEWFKDEFVQRIIKEIDNSKVAFIGNENSINIYNSTLGNIPPERLSSGCKGLILLYKEDIKINGDRLGDNCIGLLLEISSKKDVTISLGHIPPFPDKFEAVIVNNDEKISSNREYIHWSISLG